MNKITLNRNEVEALKSILADHLYHWVSIGRDAAGRLNVCWGPIHTNGQEERMTGEASIHPDGTVFNYVHL